MSKCSSEDKEPIKVERSGGNSSNGESNSSCGKNIDLKAIESEMKGLDLPVKKVESTSNKNGSAKEVTGRIVTVIPASLTITERKQHDPKKPFDSLVKKMEIPVKLVPAQEVMGQIKPLPITDIKRESFLEDDIYEFKEPEPFEFSDIRSRKDGRSKPPTPESFTENEPKVKQQKTPRLKKDSEGSEPDLPVLTTTPQKRYGSSLRESPVNKGIDNKEANVKREVKDYSRKVAEPLRSDDKIIIDESGRDNCPPVLHIKEIPLPEGADPSDMIDYFSKDEILHQLPIDMKDHKFEITEHSKESHFLSSSVVITPKKMSSKKETVVADDVVITPIKGNKLYEDSINSKELGSLIYDGASSSNRLRPVSISPIERPSVSSSHHVVSTPAHIIAQSVMPPVDSRAIAKPVPRRFDHEKSQTSTYSDHMKTDEKGDGKVIPFSKRQQHIFPHLLSRPEAEDERSEEVTIQRSTNVISSYHGKQPLENMHIDPPVLSLPEDPNVSISISSPKGTITTDIDKIAPLADKYKVDKKTVEESIEAVIMRATQEKSMAEDNSSVKESPSKPDKRRRNPGRTKKLSRELIPDTSEESDTDSKSDTLEQQRPKRRGTDGNKYSHSPAKKTLRTADASKKAAQRLDEEDRANDADEEDNEGNFFSQKASRCRKKESDDENPAQKDVRTLKKKRKVALSRRVDDGGEEIGLGDLLCKEVIPPGSPMPQDYLGVESSSPIHQSAALKQEMPFASLPTGSSFTKRTTTTHPNIPSSLQMSLQQLHPSVCIQAVSKSSNVQASNSAVSNASDLQPNVTITTLPQNTHTSLPLNSKQPGSSGSKSPISVPGGAKLIPTKSSMDKISKSPQSNNDDSSNIEATSRALSQSTSSPKNEISKISPPGRPSPLPPVDHTPPTTPESLTSTLSDSPRR